MTRARQNEGRDLVVALCGGIGGAKLALGLSHVVSAERLLVAVNTGDDFEHLGLHVSPDIDTVTYTLAGIVNTDTGWGRAEESWRFMEAIADLGSETWFRLGDKDLATHVERTHRLKAGDTLSAVTSGIRRKLGVKARVLPISDDAIRTMVETDEGLMPFQQYFVMKRCEPRVLSLSYVGAETDRLQEDIALALTLPRLRAVILCPSNPYLSLAPMLAIPRMREALASSTAPVIAVSPLVGGKAVKGPTAKIMGELGIDATAASVARYYDGLISGFVLDKKDAALAAGIGVPVAVEQTLMVTLEDRISLARACLAFADRLAAARGSRSERVA